MDTGFRKSVFGIAVGILLCVLVTHEVRAGVFPELLPGQMVGRASSVVVGTVRNIDQRNGNTTIGPQTRVALQVNHIVKGPSGKEGSTIDLIFYGGTVDGQRWHADSAVPQLTVGDTYILFLRKDYYLSPLLPAVGAIQRVVRDSEGQERVVDEGGGALRFSARHGLLHLEKVAASLVERARGAAESGGILTSASLLSEHLGYWRALVGADTRGEFPTRPRPVPRPQSERGLPQETPDRDAPTDEVEPEAQRGAE